MNDEFSLITRYFKNICTSRPDVRLGIGDDAACLTVPPGKELLVSCDTLVSDVHFLPSWSAEAIASRAVRVNVSDIAAMAGEPNWLLLALTMPTLDEQWLTAFSYGLREALRVFDLALVGGDTTRGPLSITMTIHGLVPTGKAITRRGAREGDIIFVSDCIGAAALAVSFFEKNLPLEERAVLWEKLIHPKPRLDLRYILQTFASAAIDISDGLSADLGHICQSSGVGACLDWEAIPVHPLVHKYQGEQAIPFALSGGDDYELCFTVPAKQVKACFEALAKQQITCYPIGVIEKKLGLRAKTATGDVIPIEMKGYQHF